MLSSRSRPGFRVVTRFLSSQTPPSTWAYSDVPLTEAQRALASRRDADMRANYEAVLSVYPDHAQPQDGSAKVDKIEAYKKRLIYRSKQRGWLEVDLLMGSFAVEHVPKMTLPQLQTYERILACETVDLFTFLSGQMAAPEDLKGDVLDLLLKHVNARPVGQSSPKDYVRVKEMMPN